MTQTYTMAHNDAHNNAHNDKQKLNKITHIVIHRKHEHTKKGSEYQQDCLYNHYQFVSYWLVFDDSVSEETFPGMMYTHIKKTQKTLYIKSLPFMNTKSIKKIMALFFDTHTI